MATGGTGNTLTDASASFFTSGTWAERAQSDIHGRHWRWAVECHSLQHGAGAYSSIPLGHAPDHTSQYRIQPQLVPRFPEDIAAQMFPALPPPDARAAAEGLIAGLSLAQDTAGDALLSLRIHLFFRNLLGLWACTNHACVPGRSVPCSIGRLHFTPVPVCQCGSRVLELLYCEPCGETFLGGYRRETGNPNEWFLSPDHPNLEAAPELAGLDREYCSYAVYWPAGPGLGPQIGDLDPGWRAAALESGGTFPAGRTRGTRPGDGLSLPRSCYAHSQPPRCRECELCLPGQMSRAAMPTGRYSPLHSPIRTQRTGFQKVAQMLSDTLLRHMSRASRVRRQPQTCPVF